MFIKKSFIERKLGGLIFRVLNKIENIGNCSFEKNGENFL
jgi:hypothetical protein